MASTDNPLKQLVESCITDFATWLLDSAVIDAQPLNVELLAQTVRVDQLYRVTLVDGRVVKLHIEFQGVRTHEPMPLRMLDYMTRLVKLDPALDLHSVVFYVGKEAGKDDKGKHQINGSDGEPVLSWRYQVIHLWKMNAQELLDLKRPALLPLVGQTKIDKPNEVLSKVVENLGEILDTGLRRRLFTGLLALVEDEEIIQMLEKMIEEDELLTNTPYLQRIREKTREEALAEGLTEGLAQGRAEGLTKGRAEGKRLADYRTILDILVWRFDPPASTYQEIEDMLTLVADEQELRGLRKTATQAQKFTDFQTALLILTTEQRILGYKTETK